MSQDRLISIVVEMAMEDYDRAVNYAPAADRPIDKTAYTLGWMTAYFNVLTGETPVTQAEIAEALELLA